MNILFQNWNTTDSVWETAHTVKVKDNKVVKVLDREGKAIENLFKWLKLQRPIPYADGAVLLEKDPEKWAELAQRQRLTYHRIVIE